MKLTNTTNKEVMVITGTRKGIGRSLAEYYVAKGIIVFGCSREESNLKDENYKHYNIDVSDETSVKKMIAEIARQYGKIDYLINNAGIASMNHTLLTPGSTVEKIFHVNVLGTFLFSREAAKVMSKSKWGRIVNFTTIGVPLQLEGECMYSASKASVETMTKIMAKEFANLNITVNAIGPNPVKTDLIKNVPGEKITALLNRQAIKELSGYEDIINVVEFFIDRKSKMISGQVIYLGGVS
jgi:3-oxoacyl-[acyl-carrier protein] reductase